MLTGRQIRAARAYLSWTLADLSAAADVARGTLWQAEKDAAWVGEEALRKIADTLASHGITVGRDGSLRGLEP